MKVIVFVKATQDSEAGVMPTEQLLTEMGQYNEELVKAGIMLAGEGLHPSSKGVRVQFSGWAVYGDEGADCWLLALAGIVDRRGDLMGETLSQPDARRLRNRNPSGL
jgi:hypothetical protein